ncbi:lipid-transfer protein, partial [Rhodococcus oxybenzonivorans]|nr:lipid-transfer protein [Rhodococcus oxybenzonivorans]
MRNVCISGVGMMPFTKPGRSETYDRMGAAAAAAALKDAGLEYTDVQQAFVGYVYGDSTSGQNALYEIGMTGIPVVNVNNNCSTGSSALWLARQAVASGSAECVLALGFEQMQPGALVNAYGDRPSPTARGENVAASMPGGDENAPMAAKLFGGA